MRKSALNVSKPPQTISSAFKRARADKSLPFYFFLLMIGIAVMYLTILLVSFQ